MDEFIIDGGYPLEGTLIPSGNKNAALPMLAASILTDEEVVLRNVPQIDDIRTMVEIVSALGVEVRESAERELTLRARRISTTKLDRELCRRIRASILLAGSLLARCGQITLPPPGGDVIGRRRVDTHLVALRSLGAEIDVGNSGYQMNTVGLRGTEIFLDEASVTGTENALMAACTAEGRTVIKNAASEPHVQEFALFLNKLGARISNVGTNTLIVDGVETLHGGEHEVGPDHIEIGSFIGAAAVTNGQILIKNAVPSHLPMILLVFRRLGIEVEIRGEDLFVPREQSLRILADAHGVIPRIDDAPWPGFPADLMSIVTVVATQCQGSVLVFEKMYESRMFFVDKLVSMGAHIILCDPHRAVLMGPARLHGETLTSPDIRAGMAMLIAALCAEGRSVIKNISQIDRGYERIDEKLRSLGAHIVRAGG
ncbi:MAG TPA: UDP-N-acetylglucosamine 1-carboxyvinyltransferase [Chloroflexi bacterium]|nr:UDP-N-acetylglucosamine 1-carboxyvinyltransferase [Chloroflexota bacterium]